MVIKSKRDSQQLHSEMEKCVITQPEVGTEEIAFSAQISVEAHESSRGIM